MNDSRLRIAKHPAVIAVLLLILAALSPLSGCRKTQDTPVYVVPLEEPGPTPLQCTLIRTIDSKLTRLTGVVVDPSGHIFAVGVGAVNVLDEQGNLLHRWERQEDLRCITIAEDGKVYLGAPGRIIKLNADGIQIASWETAGAGGPKLGRITSVAVRGIELLAADADQRCIHRFTVEGDFSNDIARAEAGNPDTGLAVPSPHLDCAFDSSGNALITDPGRLRLETYTLDGKFLSKWGRPGMEAVNFCGCCNPTDIALTPDGNVVTAEKGIFRVKVYDPTGRMLAFIHPELFSGKEPGMDIAVDGAGRIYVADPGDGKIRVFTLSAEAK